MPSVVVVSVIVFFFFPSLQKSHFSNFLRASSMYGAAARRLFWRACRWFFKKLRLFFIVFFRLFAPFGKKTVFFFSRLVFIAIFVFRFFVRLPYLGYLLLLSTLFVSVRKVFIATFVFVCITRLPLFFHVSAFFQKKIFLINIFKDFLMLFGALAADFPKSCDCLLTHA